MDTNSTDLLLKTPVEQPNVQENVGNRLLYWARMGGIALATLIIGFLLAYFLLKEDRAGSLSESQALVQAIADVARQSPDAQIASGTYVPGAGILLYSQVNFADDNSVRTWASQNLVVFASHFAHQSSREDLIWFIDYGPPPFKQTLIQVPLTNAADTTQHEYMT
ncbi:MAG: hypothetical protein AAF629_16530, partial [Chloroflexota bacterium]